MDIEWLNHWSGLISVLLTLVVLIVTLVWKFRSTLSDKLIHAKSSIRSRVQVEAPLKVRLIDSLLYGDCVVGGPDCILKEGQSPVTQVVDVQGKHLNVCQRCLERQLIDGKWEVNESN